MLSVSSKEWLDLKSHGDALRAVHFREMLAVDSDRFASLSFSIDGLLVDFSKKRIYAKALELLGDLAKFVDLADWRDRFFCGDVINIGEKRAVLRPALHVLKYESFPSAS